MSAATVTAVAAVAAAGTAAYSASQAGKGGSKTYGSKVTPAEYNDRVGTEDSYARQIYDDTGAFAKKGLPQIFDLSSRTNKRAMRMRERETGGDFRETIRQEGANILSLEQGQVPQDVVDSINQIVAENLGGAVSPMGGAGGFDGGSIQANNAAKMLGLTSLDMMKTGMSFGPQWRTNADSFVYKPQDAAAGMFFPAANMALDASKLQSERDYNEYVAANNIARSSAMPDPAAVGSMNDRMTGTAMMGQYGTTAVQALAGLYSGTAGTGTTSVPKSTYSSWQTGPQPGTYYTPSGARV